MASKKQSRNIKFTWQVSYLLLLILPIIIFLLTSLRLQVELNRESRIQSRLRIEGLMKSIDVELATSEMIFSYIQRSPEFKAVRDVGVELHEEEKAKLLQLSEALKQFCKDYHVGGSLYLYLKMPDVIVTPQGYTQPFLYYEENYSDTGISYSEWKKATTVLLDSSYKIVSVDQNPVNEDNFSQETIQVKRLSGGEKNACQMVIRKRYNIFTENVDMAATDLMYAILDKDGEIVYSGNLLRPLAASPLPESAYIQGKRYLFCSEKSNYSEYTYIVAVKTANASLYFVPLILLTVVTLSFGVWLLRKTVDRNYKPVQQIVAHLQKHMDLKKLSNEYEMIHAALFDMDTEKELLSNLVEQQRAQSRIIFFKILLRGDRQEIQSISDKLETHADICFPSDSFAVVLILVREYKKLFEGDLKTEPNAQRELVRMAIQNVAEEMGNRHGNRGYVENISGISLLIISLAPENVSCAEEQLSQLCGELQDFFRHELEVELELSVSAVYTGLCGISEAYRETLGQNGKPLPQEMEAYLFSSQKQEMLCAYLREGKRKAAEDVITQLMEDGRRRYEAQTSSQQCVAVDIAATVLRIAGEKDVDLDRETLLRSLLSEYRADDAAEQLIRAAALVCGGQTDKKGDLAKQVKRCVESNYQNPDLSLSFVAEQLGVNRNYLSNLFKAQMHMGLLEYINRFRIQKAELLLSATDKTTNEIAQQVGYLNVKTFLRVFKQYIGMTPTQYRKISNN